jgi:hypothetical protein
MLDKPVIAENCVGIGRIVRLSACILRYKNFVRSDSGVVTIEWVALAAGLVIGCIAVSYIIMSGLVGAASNIASQLSP